MAYAQYKIDSDTDSHLVLRGIIGMRVLVGGFLLFIGVAGIAAALAGRVNTADAMGLRGRLVSCAVLVLWGIHELRNDRRIRVDRDRGVVSSESRWLGLWWRRRTLRLHEIDSVSVYEAPDTEGTSYFLVLRTTAKKRWDILVTSDREFARDLADKVQRLVGCTRGRDPETLPPAA